MTAGDEFSPEDNLARLRADIDQMIATMPELARSAWAWYEAFRREGFADYQALYLTAVQLKDNPGRLPT